MDVANKIRTAQATALSILAVVLLAGTTTRAQQTQAERPLLLQAHTVPAEQAAAVKAWSASVDGVAGRRAVWDQSKGQVVLLAEAEVHQQLRVLLASQPTVRNPVQSESIRLSQVEPKELHQRLESLIGRPAPATWDASGVWLAFSVGLGDGGGVDLQVNRQTGEAKLDGPAEEVTAWRQVIEAIDSAKQGAGRSTGVVSARNAPKQQVRQALQAIQLGAAPAGAPAKTVAVQLPPQNAPAADPPRADPGRPNGAPGADETVEESASLLGPVQIEFVEGLDIIIVRGAQRDVDRVMAIINQIESLSAVTVPAIEVHTLQHVDSKSMADLLDSVYEQVLGPRTGTVSITPLGKPNALLVIGRTENVQTAIELAKKLDQPVEPEASFSVFPLKHASAADALRLVRDFLSLDEEGNPVSERPSRGSLTPRALVVADYRSNTLVVSAGPRDLAEVRAILERVDTAQASAVDEVRVFNLKNTLAADLRDVLEDAIVPDDQAQQDGAEGGASGQRSAALRLVTIGDQKRLDSGILAGIKIAADERANALVVTAPPASMELIAALIEQLDKTPEATAELKVFTIVNGDAVALIEMLRTLFGTEEDDNETGGLGASSSAIVKIQFSVDERTNSIIAAGAAEDLAVVEAVLLRLDGGEGRERETRVYRLKNSPADEVAASLNELLTAERDAEQAAELAISPFEQIDREVLIVSELNTNSLVVSASDAEHAKIAKLVEELDQRPPMVMIQVLIAEVRLNDTDEFGVELGLQDSLLFDRSLLSDVQTLTTTTQQTGAGGAVTNVTQQQVISANQNPGFAFNNQPLGNSGSASALARAGNVAAQGVSSFGVNRVNSELGFGGFIFAASSNSVSMLLRALQENRRLEVLSRPQIMCLDNQVGYVQVGQSVPTITGTNLTQFGQTNTISYTDVGIILQVQPRISVDGQVTMTVLAQKSAVGSELEGIPISVSATGEVLRAPRIDVTEASTTVSAISGQTVLLSGLLTKATQDIHRRVPLISEIPLLGDLFRYDSTSEERTELLIVLTPRILRDEVDMEQLKQVESARMSWVLCDVVTIHGPSGLRSRTDEWGETEAPTMYPSYVPGQDPAQPAFMQEGQGPNQIPAESMPDLGVTPASYTPSRGPVRLPESNQP